MENSIEISKVKQPNFNGDGKKVIGIVSTNSIDFVRNIFNCFNQNQIAVFLAHEKDEYKIKATGVTEVIKPKLEFGWCQLKFQPQPTEDLAQIAFTSGTTGNPKGVLLTHQALNDVVDRLNSIMELDSSIREYVGVPVNYSFGFGRCRAVATAGGEFYIPENGFNPLEIRDLLLQGSINAISAVPSLWRLLFDCQDIFGEETHAIKWIEIGSQYMSQQEKEQIRRLFPRANIVQHYGLTEASRSTFLRIDQTQGEHLESVGKGYGQTQIKLSADHRIMIKGPHVAQYLLKDGEKVHNTDIDGWLTTNDLGSIKTGYVYYQGRADDLINCAGIKLYPDNLEKQIREKLNLQTGIAVSRINDPLRGNGILIAMLRDLHLNPETVKQAGVEAIAQYGINSIDAIKVMELEEFPATATGKVKRREISQLFAEQQETQKQTQTDKSKNISQANPEEQKIIQVWQDVLGVKNIELESNFFEIGGDSLTAISVMVKMEKLGISREIIKGMLQGLSVKELARRIVLARQDSDQPIEHVISNPYTKTGININILRGLLVLCVIAGHWSAGILAMFPAGFADTINLIMANIFAAGTPGFAIIYGVSAGYSLFEIFRSDRQRFQNLRLTTLKLLIGGVLVLALMGIVKITVNNEIESITDISNTFYSVITYYLLITATMPFWFNLLNRSKVPAVLAICLSVILYGSYHYIFEPLGVYRPTGFVELAKLLVSAKYSYFNLTAGVLSGVSVGILIRQRIKQNAINSNFMWAGISLVTLAFLTSSHANMLDIWLRWFRPIDIWVWLFYLGLILIALKLNDRILSGYNQFSGQLKFICQSLSTIGILAFPLYITQGLVFPLKDTLAGVGLPNVISLLISMGLFFVSSFFLFKKVHSANFKW